MVYGEAADYFHYDDHDNTAAGMVYTLDNQSIRRTGSAIVWLWGLTSVRLETASADAEVLVTSSAASVGTFVALNHGAQTVRLGPNLDFINGLVNVYDFGASGPADYLILDDSGGGFSSTYVVNGSQITNTGFGSVTFGNIERVTIEGSSGLDTFNVTGGHSLVELRGNGGTDTFNLDSSFGNVSIDGGTGSVIDHLIIKGWNATTSHSLTSTRFFDSARTIDYANLERLTLNLGDASDTLTVHSTASRMPVIVNGRDGNDTVNVNATPLSILRFNGGLDAADVDTLNVNAGSFTMPPNYGAGTANLRVNVNNAGTLLAMIGTQTIGTLTLGAGATGSLTPNGGHYLYTKNLVIDVSAKLDLADNDLIWDYSGDSPFVTARGYVVTGRNTGTSGITSSTTTGKTVLAIIDNAVYGRTSWGDQQIDETTLIGKYTYYGDSNLDGKVTGDDYVAVDSNLGRNPGTSQWFQGDFNFDGNVTGDDYVAIDANLGEGTLDPAAYDEEQAEMIAIHAERYGGKKYVHAVEEAAGGTDKDRSRKRTSVRKSPARGG